MEINAMSDTNKLHKYAIAWFHVYSSVDEFEQFWSKLMENEVDCVTNPHNFQTYGDKMSSTIFFKTMSDRQTAMDIHALIK